MELSQLVQLKKQLHHVVLLPGNLVRKIVFGISAALSFKDWPV